MRDGRGGVAGAREERDGIGPPANLFSGRNAEAQTFYAMMQFLILYSFVLVLCRLPSGARLAFLATLFSKKKIQQLKMTHIGVVHDLRHSQHVGAVNSVAKTQKKEPSLCSCGSFYLSWRVPVWHC